MLTTAQVTPADFWYPQRGPWDAKGIFNSRLHSSRAFKSGLLFLLIESVLDLRPCRDGHVTRGQICICSGQPVLGYRDRSNAGELSEATLHLLSYKINQALVLRTAFHSLPSYLPHSLLLLLEAFILYWESP